MADKPWPKDSLMYTALPAGTEIIGYHKRNDGSRLRLLNAHRLLDLDDMNRPYSKASMSHLDVEVLNLGGSQAHLFSDLEGISTRIKEIEIPWPEKGQSFFHANGWMALNDFETLVSKKNHDERFAENAVKYGLHKRAERSAAVVKLKKHEYRIKTNGVMPCETCQFSFMSKYGIDFLEAHHMTPLSQLDGKVTTTTQDLALLCANCHRAIHRVSNQEGNILSVEEFRKQYFPEV